MSQARDPQRKAFIANTQVSCITLQLTSFDNIWQPLANNSLFGRFSAELFPPAWGEARGAL